MIYLILTVLLVGFIWAIGYRRKPHRMNAMRATMNSRVVISEREYLHQLRIEAKQMRCPHPGYHGRKHACGRAPGRPCVHGCRGRIDLSTDWHG